MARALTKKRYAALEVLAASDSAADLTTVLAEAPGVLVARAARRVVELHDTSLTEALESAYDRLSVAPLEQGAGADPGCRGKLAIVDALRAVDARSARVWLAATCCVQREPVFGGRQDTAGPVRCAGLAGLAEVNHPRTLEAAAQLLADEDPPVRAAAAQALGTPDAFVDPSGPAAMLRLRVLAGDTDAEVVQASLASLLVLQPGEETLAFLRSYLDAEATELSARPVRPLGPEALSEAAAYALASVRQNDALDVLIDWYDSEPDAGRARTALTAIALTRLPRGFDFLYALLTDAPSHTAVSVIEALAVYSGDAALRERALDALRVRGDKALSHLADDKL